MKIDLTRGGARPGRRARVQARQPRRDPELAYGRAIDGYRALRRGEPPATRPDPPPRGLPSSACRSSPTSTSTRSSPPSRSSSARSCGPFRSSSAATRTAAASSRPRTTSRGGSGSCRRCRAPRRSAAAPRPSSCARAGRSTGSTRARSGRSCARSCRRSSRPGSTRATSTSARVAPAFDDARALAEAVRAVVRARTRLSCSLGRRDVEGRGEGRVRPAQARRAHGGASGPRGRVPRAVPDAGSARESARVQPSGSPRPGSRRSAALAALEDDELRRVLPGKVGLLVRDRARGHRPEAARGLDRAHLDLERGDVRARRRRRRAAPRRAAPDGGRARRHLSERGQTARTVTTKLRYPDFAIRTRSTSLGAGTDDAERIGELACSLLDRALRDRPGPLRLVGVGVSGLADHAQLALTV